MNKQSPFVDTQFLFDNLDNPEIAIVDASWHMPNAPESALENFHKHHIPGAVYFDLDDIANTTSELPHMVATPDKFSRMVGKLGIGDSDTIVIYDSAGLFSAARVWWNFKIMGAKNCFVLRGGLPKWIAENRPLAHGEVDPKECEFRAEMTKNLVVDMAEIKNIVSEQNQSAKNQIVDARAAARFSGVAAEPRPGMRSGSIPQSLNLPFMELVKDGEMVEAAQIKQQLEQAGVDLQAPIIASCGSGVTAPILCLALAEIGIDAMRVYDGSWSEWGQPGAHPVIGAEGKPV